MGIPSSVTRFGKNEPFDLQVSRNQIYDHKIIFKFGFNPDINGDEETIWDGGGIYAYPSAATVMKVSSSSANDTAAGTGARTILVQGLDGDYNEAEEIVTLNGQTAVNTTTSFLRVNRAYVLTAGSGGTAAGNIYVGVGTVTSGVPATIYAQITLGENQTLMGLWTVPAGYTGYFDHFNVATGSTTVNQYITVRAIQRNFGGVFRTMIKQTIGAGGVADFVIKYPIEVQEKTDLEMRASSSGANNLVSADFSVIYIKNISN
jgi:stage V sporulation protein SpoVS